MEAHRRPGSDTFEGLWLLRACYSRRSAYDARGTLTVDEAILYAERLMRALHLGGFAGRHRAA